MKLRLLSLILLVGSIVGMACTTNTPDSTIDLSKTSVQSPPIEPAPK